jgi:peptide deformylase
VLRLVYYPHPALRFESRPVLRIDDALRETVREMFELMYENHGIGLAANQVGLPFRFFLLNLTSDREQRDKEQVFINPEIIKRHASIEDEEGCLSLPGLFANVSRAKKIKVKAYDLDGNPLEADAEELYSRAVQHEIDHLDGRLFIDLISSADRVKLNPKLREFEEKHRQSQTAGEYPDDETITKGLTSLANGEWGLTG